MLRRFQLAGHKPLALVGGATAAMWIVSIGKWILVPMQNWPVHLESERLFEPLWALRNQPTLSTGDVHTGPGIRPRAFSVQGLQKEGAWAPFVGE